MIDLRGTDDANQGMIIEEGVLPGPLAGFLSAPLSVAADAIGVDTDRGSSTGSARRGASW